LGILDQTYFSQEDPDGKELLGALLTLYYLQGRTISLVEAAGIKPAQFNWNDSMKDVWPKILEHAAATRGLLRLLKVISEDPASTAYPVFRRLLETPASVQADPFLACLLGTGHRRAFIDRATLRDHIRNLADPDGPRVLIVTGTPSSGKSYSWYLINHVRRQGEFLPHPVDLSQWSGPPAGPADVMGLVAARLCWEMPPVDCTALDDAQARTLLYWFTGKMAREPGRNWLIFDGLQRPTMTDAALRLVEGIATAAEQETAGELRVVLIEYSRSLPQDVDPYALRDQIKQVGVAELRAFFQVAARDVGKEVDGGGLDLLVQEILGPWPYPPIIRLAEVSAKAGNLARRFFKNGADHG
jgi:Effector-associated domain 1